jgi:hypothetical protein
MAARCVAEHGANVADCEHDLGHLASKLPLRRCSLKSSLSAFVVMCGEDADVDALLIV